MKNNRDNYFIEKRECTSNLKHVMLQDIKRRKLPRALRFNDRVSMAFSRELRVPFLDHRIFEYTFSLAEKILFSDGRPKGLIRKLFKKKLPKKIVSAPKRHIQTPQSSWLNTNLRRNLIEIFESKEFSELPFFDSKKVLSDYNSLAGKKIPNSFYIWQAFSLFKWDSRNRMLDGHLRPEIKSLNSFKHSHSKI